MAATDRRILVREQCETYAKHFRHYAVGEIPKPLVELLQVTEFQHIVDIGCGDGALLATLYMRGWLKKAEIWGVDQSPIRLARLAASLATDVRCIEDDAQTLGKLPDAYFDVAISTQVIEHVPDDAGMLAAVSRILREGGVCYLDTVLRKPYGWYFRRNAKGEWMLDPTHVREYRSASELIGKLPPELVVRKQGMLRFHFSPLRMSLRVLGAKRIPASLSAAARFSVPIPGYRRMWFILEKCSPDAAACPRQHRRRSLQPEKAGV